jgi:hypothetical protein
MKLLLPMRMVRYFARGHGTKQCSFTDNLTRLMGYLDLSLIPHLRRASSISMAPADLSFLPPCTPLRACTSTTRFLCPLLDFKSRRTTDEFSSGLVRKQSASRRRMILFPVLLRSHFSNSKQLKTTALYVQSLPGKKRVHRPNSKILTNRTYAVLLFH